MKRRAALVLLVATGCGQGLGKLGIIDEEDAGRPRDAAPMDASDAGDASDADDDRE